MNVETPELVVVVPVYNEESAIVGVLQEWKTELEKVVPRFLFLVINDGSKDGTLKALSALTWPQLKVHTHSNRGHGQSCLVGYQEAQKLGAPYVFQIDSDGQCDPVAFKAVWEKRDQAPAVYGRRMTRDDGFSRRLVTRVLRWSLKATQRTRLNDTNVPYRLYRTSVVAEVARQIPATFDLANIGLALRMEPLGFVEVPIHFRDRVGGHASVRYWGFVRKGRKLFQDLRSL
ncbi:MAG: glycosyltransferase family 2 protein [Opitutaceae bacterium]|nr:glycosyltransferase family 2 protein [Opitutaceae bacterium]